MQNAIKPKSTDTTNWNFNCSFIQIMNIITKEFRIISRSRLFLTGRRDGNETIQDFNFKCARVGWYLIFEARFNKSRKRLDLHDVQQQQKRRTLDRINLIFVELWHICVGINWSIHMSRWWHFAARIL